MENVRIPYKIFKILSKVKILQAVCMELGFTHPETEYFEVLYTCGLSVTTVINFTLYITFPKSGYQATKFAENATFYSFSNKSFGG